MAMFPLVIIAMSSLLRCPHVEAYDLYPVRLKYDAS